LEHVRSAKLTPEAMPDESERARIHLGFQKLSEQLRKGDAQVAACIEFNRELNRKAFEQARERTGREYTAAGLSEPHALQLGLTAANELGYSMPKVVREAAE
jgi:hypothetical protein